MLGNFTNCLPVTLAYEGLWSDHARDPGGATMRGITLAVYRQHRPGATKADLRAITQTEVEMIYRAGYWSPIKGDDLPPGVDLATFDFGVNSGVSRASKYLQAVVGAGVDGKVGKGTLAAVRGRSGKEVIQGLCGKRLSFLQALSTFSTFGKGWSRRVASVEAKSVAMWLAAEGMTRQAMSAELLSEATVAADQSKEETRNVAKPVAIGSGVGGVDTIANAGPNWWLIVALVVVTLACIAVFVVRSRQHKDRADAYAMAAAE